ncbi:hypothetical protein OMO38_15465 [Chryseobacterium sp. 09-1422]|uniref:Cupin n=1 Tax=Chryseobacterium kimseyorum TaxID=2984028 RepID=A0ABT3I1J6_9FLAO|nr:hypothetical protein [Chryseobacterium kimseyorum]MCW3169922.1 hypothetical protein [Chryseobacterium kimseyorum]
MKITRIFSDERGESHFEDLEIPFRKVSADYDYGFHHAPQKQYIVLLDGGVEIETSLGEIRKFQTGEILLVEDVSGKGHKTKNLETMERTSLFLHL